MPNISSLHWVACLLLCCCLGCTTPGDDIIADATPGVSSSPGAVSTPTATATPREGSEEPVEVRKFTIETKSGQKWQMESEQGTWLDDRSVAKVKEVTWYLLDEQDVRTVKVEAPEAEVEMDKDLVTFYGETVATRLGFDETLKVQHLVYKGKERKFYGSEGVVWQRETGELSGETLTATAELDKVQLKGRVKGKTVGGLPGLGLKSKADREQRTR